MVGIFGKLLDDDFLDFLVVLLHIGQNVKIEVLYVLGAGYGLYLIAMSFAMFPGWTEDPLMQTSDALADQTTAEPIAAPDPAR